MLRYINFLKNTKTIISGDPIFLVFGHLHQKIYNPLHIDMDILKALQKSFQNTYNNMELIIYFFI